MTASVRAGDAAPKPPVAPPGPLATPWPVLVGCPGFDRLELSVDDRYGAVEWRNGEGTSSQLIEVTRPEGRDDARDRFVKTSRSFPCGDEESLCVLYPRRPDRNLHGEHEFIAARAVKPIASPFPVGQLEMLVLRRAEPQAAERRQPAGPIKSGFGLRLILSCADPSQPSLHWACDERSCLLQTFRKNPAVGAQARWALAGPFTDEWARGTHASDLARLLDARPGALKKEDAVMAELVRALAQELVAVIDLGCAGAACSPRVATLREASRVLATSSTIRLLEVKAKSASDREFGQRETGWVARIRDGATEAELACARHYHHLSADNPPHDQCRLGVLARGIRLGDYFPYWFQQVELPDGGGIELRGATPKLGAEQGPAWGKDQIVITGSAVATAQR